LIGIPHSESKSKLENSDGRRRNISQKNKKRTHKKGNNKEKEGQLSLLMESDISGHESPLSTDSLTLQSSNKRLLKVPNSMEKIKESSTRLEPMIFWALAEIRAKGENLTLAVEVERTISQYLTDDHSKVESTNIARKLRSKAMQNRSWLITHRTGKGDKKLYGISDNWKTYWKEMFDEDPPDP
jgi:hypothetical protein